ncbi:kinase-like domain-containing protein [Jimgerdemannia flammicorona]|uniref:Kinase-like domain-containing protein n=1 Tax=Jimgerdemannia flammicorona TaxID=994334 RepID=A0A433DAA1_9FUNG|nr:kinase-like domain-containing protein [Jimgerdemannia flammicorona]
MVMEHADGGNLHEFLSNNPADTWRKIYNHAHNIAWALYEMHQLGVVHGDLHPKNVLFSRNIPHLVDVGLSTDARNPPASLRLDYCPHKHYMAPEEQTSTMSDVFSFGLILWFLITTVDPWSGLRKSRGSEEAGYFEIPGTPDEYQQIYMDCLRKDPKNRPSMETVYKRLRKLWKKPDDEAVKIPHEEIERIVRGQELDSDEESDDDEEAGETSSFGIIVSFFCLNYCYWDARQDLCSLGYTQMSPFIFSLSNPKMQMIRNSAARIN